ncbi:Interferon-induced protein 44-like [Mizuhopecten yessoensis]|uniref:Interferon-induced protein 44-like n=2 Tax=Mizuhopecten yessoensis TaxID=6573 RepID=A0A210PTU9_MIZYE|nr:Interferon-induced protein 44-like [Mizuhopecten yessoensis]
MTTNLKQPDKVQLSTWIDPSKRHNFTLLYKISRDGCNAQTFHSLCDNKGPTVTVLYNTSESVYGAYTAVSWQSNGSYSIDAKAFLFKLKYNGTAHSMKFPNKTDGKKAIYGHANYGPTFGSGYDLYCFSGTINKSGIIFPLNGSATLGYAYDMQGQDYNTVMNGHLEVLDLEVYSVQERMLLQKPWIRNVDWSQKFEQEIKEKVATYKPLPGLDLQQRRILLVGQVGAGKSSYFNTVNSIFRGHISSQANVGTTEQHSLTTSYRMYEIHDGYGSKTFNFRLCDTRGLEENQGIDDQDICYLLDGHVPDRYQPDALGFVKNPMQSDKIHCVAFVLDASDVDDIPEKVLERIKAMQPRMNHRGIPQVVLLTKIDEICEETSEDLSNVFFSTVVKECVDKVASLMGLPRSHILPVKNYECEVELDQNINILALLSLRRILNFVDDFLFNKSDEIAAEKMKRLKVSD